ncbi:NAD(P)-dependent alcohol dehydrogenase [Paenibacillus validus]|uniref:NAD(P)-dependent alcohol dehydrogenase n=1 Tax=Paenibacillus TaxID=44249 RepID=UPI000FD95A27|nr:MULTISPECIES: NAD(P)-dependent alcohol dehydrogenase [Paenibacillus]MED4599266.1 NAD(P)-dependent alcohol dehydrogenase [Paenibacillus validus]MED4605009.1 NAD(P)-dependent alcohol dehydrogenase [Paenibacillus validus]
MLIKAAVTHHKGSAFKIETVILSEPKENEVLIKVVASGVCHTDAIVRDQIAPVPLPAVLGHEGSGIVEKIGFNVRTVRPGDHVVLSFSSCGQCEECLTGHPTTCNELNPLNFGGRMSDHTHRIFYKEQEVSTFFGQSSFSTYVVANEKNLVKVDKDVDLALLGPLGCGIQTGSGTVLNKLKPEFGSTIAIYGCGAVGLSAVMAAKIAGCSKIIAIDVHDHRLELAMELGATHALNGKEVVDVVAQIKEMTNGGAHYAIETTGVPVVVRQSVQALKNRGTVAIVGATGEVTFNIHQDLMADGKTMVGVVEGDAVPQVFIPKLIEYYKRGQFPFNKLIKFYNFDEINEAFEDSHTGKTVKPVLKM